jgi:hypothetical protein
MRIKNTIRILRNVAAGSYSKDLEDLRKVGRRSEQDELVPAVMTVMSAIDTLVTDAATLSQAAVEGKLSVRANSRQHQGEYRRIIQGVNDTLDAVIAPVQEARVVLAKVAAGDLTARVEGDYHGDHILPVPAATTHINRLLPAIHCPLPTANCPPPYFKSLVYRTVVPFDASHALNSSEMAFGQSPSISPGLNLCSRSILWPHSSS